MQAGVAPCVRVLYEARWHNRSLIPHMQMNGECVLFLFGPVGELFNTYMTRRRCVLFSEMCF